MISKRSDDPIAILIIASLVRDDFPWLYEPSPRSSSDETDGMETFEAGIVLAPPLLVLEGAAVAREQ